MTYPTLIETIATNGKITKDQATKVGEYYLSRKIRAARRSVDGIAVMHGAFFDYAVIRRALATLED